MSSEGANNTGLKIPFGGGCNDDTRRKDRKNELEIGNDSRRNGERGVFYTARVCNPVARASACPDLQRAV